MIHPTAIVSARAQIGANVSIGAYSVIGDDVLLHDGVEIANHVSLEGPCEIGSGTVVYPFTSLGAAPQDLKYEGEETRLVIGERNQIRECVTMNRGTSQGGGLTLVGDDNLFMTQAHIAHDCRVGSHNVFANYTALAGHVEFGDYVTIGAYSGMHQFCRAGNHSFIGAKTKVVKDVLPYSRTDGHEAKCYGANTIGLRRRGFTNEAIRHIQHAFHLLLTSRLNTTQALERIREEMTGIPEIDYLIDFIAHSQRGVTK
ncbi:MAG: acyl-ACP--UDP-N-acetylglucosamine O-acyltransferase [Blastocatellia bacterium]|nr:acyl-ACP--UDP-N-acetylglucosamine O-acyltransferase [Blastocatellia bacterium]